MVRDPKDWFASAVNKEPNNHEDVGQAVSLWQESVRASLWNRAKYGDRVCLIRFEDLVNKNTLVMHYLADFLGIQFDDILLIPTFNRFPICTDASNSGYKTLEEDELEAIAEMTDGDYQVALSQAVTF
jgi:hypothetical protein